MKNRKVLWSVVVMGILAGIIVLNRKNPEPSETLPVETQESAQNIPVEAEAPAPIESGPAPAGASADSSNDAVKPETDTANSLPSDEVAATIKKNLAGARKLLQKKAVIEQSMSEDVHHTPKVTVDAARRLGEIAELEAQHPEQAETFREFYLECARDERAMTVTRSQCLDKYMKAAKLDAAAQKQFLAGFPEEIVRLVEALQ